jgi:hypothetical protein
MYAERITATSLVKSGGNCQAATMRRQALEVASGLCLNSYHGPRATKRIAGLGGYEKKERSGRVRISAFGVFECAGAAVVEPIGNHQQRPVGIARFGHLAKPI